MGFSGWSAQAVEFFKGLQADNTKAYWSARKAFYETSVREPMAELLGELSGEFGPGRISRPYRDVRFRADKSPYKTEIYATLDRGGYMKFSADGLTAALGYYMMTRTQLERYWRAVDDQTDGAQLAEVVARLRAEGLEVGGGQTLKSAPRGYPRDHPRAELLRCNGVSRSVISTGVPGYGRALLHPAGSALACSHDVTVHPAKLPRPTSRAARRMRGLNNR